MAKKQKNNNQSDPSQGGSEDANFITCSFQMTPEQMQTIDIVKLNSMPNWGYEEVNSGKGIQHWAKGKIESQFDQKWNSIYSDKEQCYNLCKRSFRIDEQNDGRNFIKKELGIAKESARGALNSYKVKLLERLITGGMSEKEALMVVNAG